MRRRRSARGQNGQSIHQQAGDHALASPLGRRVARPFDAGAEKHRGWHELGILVISPEADGLSWSERALLSALGERLYGKRNETASSSSPRGGSHGGA